MQLTIELPDTDAAKLRTAAAAAGVSVPEFAAALLKAQHVAGPLAPTSPPEKPARSFYDVVIEEGLLEGGGDYPADLLTNPKYMEDFGR